MKKILFAALAALAITSCSQNEEIEAPTQKTEINFRSVVGKSSRAAEATRHYKIFCVNGNTGFRNESRIFYFIHLQNEEAYERKESSSA